MKFNDFSIKLNIFKLFFNDYLANNKCLLLFYKN